MEPSNQPQVFCKDCRHNQAGPIARFLNFTPTWTCALDWKPAVINPVTGQTTAGSYYLCSSTRTDPAVCGRDGKAWEPRHKTDLFKYIKHVR